MRALELQIRVHGWALIQVDDGPTSWCYTVGLLENYDHPELTMVDVDLAFGSRLLRELVDDVTRTGRLSSSVLDRYGLECVTVHPEHLHGDLFGTWSNLYGAPLEPGDMVQVVLPDHAFCDCHVHAARRLDIIDAVEVPHRGPNRAERRRRARRGRPA